MVISNRDSLRIRALISKYKVRSDWMDREAPKHASQTWKVIERQKKIIERGACFIVGDGVAIDIWKDPWVPWLPNFKPLARGDLEPVNLVVACLIN